MSPSVPGFTWVKASTRPSGDHAPALCCTAPDIEPPPCGIAAGIEPAICGAAPGMALVLGTAPGMEPVCGIPPGGVTPTCGMSTDATSRSAGPLRFDGIHHIVNGSGIPARNVSRVPSGVQSGAWLEPSDVTLVKAPRANS